MSLRVRILRHFRLSGFAILAVLVAIGHAHAMSYKLVDWQLSKCKGGVCPKIIVATGEIQQDEYLNFAQFVDEAAKTTSISKYVVINSPGGFNIGGLGLGIVLRKLKMSVIVAQSDGETITATSGISAGTCASACVLVLAGGQGRYFVTGSRIGVHRSHLGGAVLDPLGTGDVSGTIDHASVKAAYVRHFRQMGIGVKLVDFIDSTPPESMHWLTTAELAKFKLAQDSSRLR